MYTVKFSNGSWNVIFTTVTGHAAPIAAYKTEQDAVVAIAMFETADRRTVKTDAEGYDL